MSQTRLRQALGWAAACCGALALFPWAAWGAQADGFEGMASGKPPLAPWRCYCAKGDDAIEVTERRAASGTKALAISCNIPRDERHRRRLPMLRRPVEDAGATGTAVFEGSLLFAPSADTRVVISLNGGPRGKRSVSLLNCLGALSCAGRLVWKPVVRDRWCRFRFVIDKAAGTAELSVGEKGGVWRNVFRALPVGRPEEVFPVRRITIYFGGPAKKGVCAYLDDLSFQSIP